MPVYRGHQGIIQIGPTNALSEFPYVRTWSFDVTNEILIGGPWINNNVREKEYGVQDGSGSLEYDISMSAAYKALRTAVANQDAIRLLLQNDEGEQIIIPEILVSSMTRANPADGVYNGSIEFEPKGTFTIQDTP